MAFRGGVSRLLHWKRLTGVSWLGRGRAVAFPVAVAVPRRRRDGERARRCPPCRDVLHSAARVAPPALPAAPSSPRTAAAHSEGARRDARPPPPLRPLRVGARRAGRGGLTWPVLDNGPARPPLIIFYSRSAGGGGRPALRAAPPSLLFPAPAPPRASPPCPLFTGVFSLCICICPRRSVSSSSLRPGSASATAGASRGSSRGRWNPSCGACFRCGVGGGGDAQRLAGGGDGGRSGRL